MKQLLFLLLFLITQQGIAQVKTGWRFHLSDNRYDTITVVILIAIDTMAGNTAKAEKVKKDKERAAKIKQGKD